MPGDDQASPALRGRDPERSDGRDQTGDRASGWHFLTNHSHVMLALHRDPDLRQRDIAAMVGITEGAVQRILDDLEREGYLTRSKVGRRNHYTLDPDRPLRHPMEAHHTVADLLTSLHD